MSRRRTPREFASFTIPDIVAYFAEGKVELTFLKGELHFFFVGFPHEGHTIPIPIDEIDDLIDQLSDIAASAALAEALEKAKEE